MGKKGATVGPSQTECADKKKVSSGACAKLADCQGDAGKTKCCLAEDAKDPGKTTTTTAATNSSNKSSDARAPVAFFRSRCRSWRGCVHVLGKILDVFEEENLESASCLNLWRRCSNAQLCTLHHTYAL